MSTSKVNLHDSQNMSSMATVPASNPKSRTTNGNKNKMVEKVYTNKSEEPRGYKKQTFQNRNNPNHLLLYSNPSSNNTRHKTTATVPPSNRNDRKLRNMQQRLLVLSHAAKCLHPVGRCPVTRHCAGMKQLWKHIAECKDINCGIPHCVSSRYILTHYQRCADVHCPICGPVRDTYHSNHAKQKQMQALKQRHQQAVQQNEGEPVEGAPAVIPACLVQQITGGLSLSQQQEPIQTGAFGHES